MIQNETICLKGFGLSKSFYGGRSLFRDLSFSISGGSILGISGANGSGKSTLMGIMAGFLSPSAGGVEFWVNEKKISKDKLNNYYGFSAPYLGLYEEFNIEEHAKIYSSLGDFHFDEKYFNKLLKDSAISSSRKKLLRHYSSGMKQRAKLILSVLSMPKILFMDEPSTNLDEAGKLFAIKLAQDQSQRGGIVVMASNDEGEIQLCDEIINI